MRSDEFDYKLPEELIAQQPLTKRDSCRLLCLDKETGAISHRFFRDLLTILRPGDRLIFNDTKVLPARLFARKATGARLEFLFTERKDDFTWIALVKPASKFQVGAEVTIENSNKKIVLKEILEDGERLVALVDDNIGETMDMVLEKYGIIPLPGYIEREPEKEDWENYQTVFALNPGAVAAPTAGLHFTNDLMEQLKAAGVDTSFVTLHVGIGTFRPVKVEDVREHVMHEEKFELSEKTAKEIIQTRERGGRIIAVGTTVVRVLEHCALQDNALTSSKGRTRIFIYPPYKFKVIDGLITNFHLPKSTLLMLVSSLGGKENVLNAYKECIKERYRFFSYGDAMIFL